MGGVPVYLYASNSEPKSEVLAENTQVTPSTTTNQTEYPTLTLTVTLTPTPTPTPTETPVPTLTPEPTLIPTPTAVPQPLFTPEQIHGFMERFAGQYGVDVNVLRHIAVCESGFNPLTITLNYAGLYQFSPNTWKNYRQEMGEDSNPDLRVNAEEAVQTAAFVLSTNRAYIWPNCVP